MSRIAITVVTSIVLLGAWPGAMAEAKGKDKSAAAQSGAPPKPVNACGCYSNATGGCLCGRKAKCGCPGECEPKGCDEKRAKQMEKEIAAETKKAAEADRKAKQNEKKNAAESDRNEAAKAKSKPKTETKSETKTAANPQ